MSLNAREILSGRDPALLARTLRASTALLEPIYASTLRLLNTFYSAGLLRSRGLPCPTISVGNITTGGTGKTPVVEWLATALAARGQKPAVLLRGYRVGGSMSSDEAELLQAHLPRIPVAASPSRVDAAAAVLREHADVTCFLLDDGFQHRKVRRDFDLVLVNAAEPFGFGHVLPRGLLREPLAGLRRASAVLLTRTDLVSPGELETVERTIRVHTRVPIYRSVHTVSGMEALARPFFAFAGIGDPDSFGRQLAAHPTFKGYHWFADHHAYSERDVEAVAAEGKARGAEVLVTTEKDWTKVGPLANHSPLPIRRLGVTITFPTGDDTPLLSQLLPTLPGGHRRPIPHSGGGEEQAAGD